MDDTGYWPRDYPGNTRPARTFTSHQRTSQLNSRARPEKMSHVTAVAVEGMRSRSERLKSFVNWPTDAPVGPIDLAEAGFFYLGQSDRVKCFSCGCVVHRWSHGDKPVTEHRRISALCTYLASLDEHRPASAPSQDPRMKDERNRLASFAGWPVDSPVKSTDLAEAGFYYTGTSDRVQCFSCLGAIHKWDPGDKAWDEHRRLFPDCDFVNRRETGNIPIKRREHREYQAVHGAPAEDQQQPWHIPTTQVLSVSELCYTPPVYNMTALSTSLPSAYPSQTHYQYESMRIESFQDPLWPPESAALIGLLGQAGFYYTGASDIVRCFSCQLELGGWKRDHSPFGRHMVYNPACPFVEGHDTTNIPTSLEIKADDIVLSGQMRSTAQRLASFLHWPSRNPVSGIELAEAGFYYRGPGDLVVCCSCGILVSNWMPGDKAVNEHKKHNDRCHYVCMYLSGGTTTGSRILTQADQIPMET